MKTTGCRGDPTTGEPCRDCGGAGRQDCACCGGSGGGDGPHACPWCGGRGWIACDCVAAAREDDAERRRDEIGTGDREAPPRLRRYLDGEL